MLKYRIGLMAVLTCAGIYATPSYAQGPCACEGVHDCNCNGVDDICDVSCSNTGEYCDEIGLIGVEICTSINFSSCGTSYDCNGNNKPDECDPVATDLIHPCTADPATTLSCVATSPPSACRCEVDWDEAASWSDGVPDCVSVGTILHSNADIGFCDGGAKDGDPCILNFDCGGRGGTCVLEDFLTLSFTTSTNAGVILRTESTAAAIDQLEVGLEGTGTMTVGSLELDATNGTLSLGVSGTLKTN